MSERRFDDREVALIFKGAASLERQTHAPGGLTLPELERVAVEAGLDPAMVRRAAAELDATRAASSGDRWRGGPRALVIVREVEVEGEVAVDASHVADALLAAVRRIPGVGMGTATTLGRTFTWRGQLDGAQTDVNVVPAQGRTTIEVRVALDGVSQGTFASWFVAAGGGGGFLAFAALVNPLGAVAVVPAAAVAGVGYAVARRRYARKVAAYAARAQALADAVAAAGTTGSR
ncbi:hypothetical protein [Roseisolibacter agri]|uniref:Uncharacterized protein n=1 Tax=Roseisolibacter agri TaxID=2014610 RepID=A0AA37QC14_9BACT|nr:hypothetical protein [Roseisolibacter agri]GLC23490.1 hypothetical protein rosag_00030 [Roseisolibacter agri]